MGPEPRRLPRRSVFWRVAGILIGVQLATGALAVFLSARFAEERSLELVTGNLRLRLDALAEEIEQRAAPFPDGLADLPLPLRLDLAYRFPDPVILVTPEGQPVLAFPPADERRAAGDVPPRPDALPPNLAEYLESGDVTVQVDGEDRDETWGLAPLYDPEGVLVGGVLVQPLVGSLAREMAGTREAYRRALMVTGGLAILIALLLGAFFTWQLVRPLRGITRQVERIGAGDYGARIDVASADEFGRLASSVNRMAEAVQHSISTLKATDALRRELIANVGHDLRTPLAAMLGYLEESQHQLDAGKAEEAKRALETAERQGYFLRQLVGDLFELSLLDSAVAPLRREPVPLAELLTEAAHRHRAEFHKAGVDFRLDLSPALPVLQADGVRLLRMMDNLLVNARQHTPPGGCVTLSSSTHDGQLVVRVTDTGTGMESYQLERIFDRYYRGEDARTRNREGTGLGLPIARAVARAHGGDLRVESTSGAGTTFTMVLPLEGEGADAPSET